MNIVRNLADLAGPALPFGSDILADAPVRF